MDATHYLALGSWLVIALILWPLISCDIDRNRVRSSFLEVSILESVLWGFACSLVFPIYLGWKYMSGRPGSIKDDLLAHPRPRLPRFAQDGD